MKPKCSLLLLEEPLPKPGTPLSQRKASSSGLLPESSKDRQSAGESCGDRPGQGLYIWGSRVPPPPPAPSPQPDLERAVVTRSISPRLPPFLNRAPLPLPARKQLEVVVIVMAWSVQGLSSRGRGWLKVQPKYLPGQASHSTAGRRAN